ncbi:MAG: metal ABC transporter permease [Verrucomicrobiota bacterium]|nr:metal ABC transporter permease [Verrucomicrobiota bacterium]
MKRAFLACAVIGFTNGFVGAFILLRRLALLTDALSHSLLPGIVIGILLFGLSPLSLFAGALMSALFVAVGGQVIARSSRIKDETAIGVLYTFAFALGITLHKASHIQKPLEDYLFGNILGTSNDDLWICLAIGIITVPVLTLLQRPILLSLFEPDVARTQGVNPYLMQILLMVSIVFSMIASLQAAGVVLAVGLMIGPAAIVYLYTDSYQRLLWGSAIVGLVGSVGGLYISYWTSVPPGACIVLLISGAFLASLVLSPRYGWIRSLLHKKHLHEESLARWQSTAPHTEKKAEHDSKPPQT